MEYVRKVMVKYFMTPNTCPCFFVKYILISRICNLNRKLLIGWNKLNYWQFYRILKGYNKNIIMVIKTKKTVFMLIILNKYNLIYKKLLLVISIFLVMLFCSCKTCDCPAYSESTEFGDGNRTFQVRYNLFDLKTPKTTCWS